MTTSSFTHFFFELCKFAVRDQCCFTSTETVRTFRDQDDHFFFHTVFLELCKFTVRVQCKALRPQKPFGLLGMGSPVSKHGV